MLVRIWMEQQEISFTAGGNANGTATWRDSLVASYKTKHTPSMSQCVSVILGPRD